MCLIDCAKNNMNLGGGGGIPPPPPPGNPEILYAGSNRVKNINNCNKYKIQQASILKFIISRAQTMIHNLQVIMGQIYI
jgi:hypothetical protein